MKGKDRVVRQPGSLNCYETVGEKAFLSPTSSVHFFLEGNRSSFLSPLLPEIYSAQLSPPPFFRVVYNSRNTTSAKRGLDTRNYGIFQHIFNNDKRIVRDVSLRFSRDTFPRVSRRKLNVSSYVPFPSNDQFDPL